MTDETRAALHEVEQRILGEMDAVQEHRIYIKPGDDTTLATQVGYYSGLQQGLYLVRLVAYATQSHPNDTPATAPDVTSEQPKEGA